MQNNLPATPETENRHNPTEEQKKPPGKQRYFTFEQVPDRAHKNAAFDRGLQSCLVAIRVTARPALG